MKNFEIEFVKRTKELLLQYDGSRDMSILINCTLGLIILPYEATQESPPPLWDTELDKITNLPSFRLETFKPIEHIKKKSGVKYHPKTLAVLLEKIRHGLAHQHIEPVNENAKFAGVIIKNYFPPNSCNIDLEVRFNQQELKEFALFIADEYLKNRTQANARNQTQREMGLYNQEFCSQRKDIDDGNIPKNT